MRKQLTSERRREPHKPFGSNTVEKLNTFKKCSGEHYCVILAELSCVMTLVEAMATRKKRHGLGPKSVLQDEKTCLFEAIRRTFGSTSDFWLRQDRPALSGNAINKTLTCILELHGVLR